MMKFGGKCAYSGTELLPDWQVDHIKPLVRTWKGDVLFKDAHNIDNMVPCQRIINHYKGSIELEDFRNWLLGELHIRLGKLPKKTKREQTIKRKEYLMEVAYFFGIDEKTPFSGVFYFEEVLGLKRPDAAYKNQNQETTNQTKFDFE